MIINLILEEIRKFIFEYEDDTDWDLYEKFDDIKRATLDNFLEHKKKGIKSQPWRVIPFYRLKKNMGRLI